MAVSNGITSAPKGSEPPAQLARRAADAVRDMIRRGDLLPGEKVHQVDVAKIAGISRSPLREALRTLEAEGLVRYESNRGYVVSRLGRARRSRPLPPRCSSVVRGHIRRP